MARTTARRAGATSAAALFALPVLLLLVGLIVYVARARDARTEVQHGADAAALAAARELADDDLLLDTPEAEAARRDRARGAADRLAAANFAQGRALALRPNPDNDPDGDLVFGATAGPFSPFKPGDRAANAVRVTVRGPQVRDALGGTGTARKAPARATAYLDFAVLGFRPVEGRAPVVPLALFTDHTGAHASGLDARLADKADRWRLEDGRWAPGADGLPEVVVVVGRGPLAGEVPAAFVRFGADGPAQSLEQVRAGATAEECENFAGGLVLGEHNTLTVDGSGACPDHDDHEFGLLVRAFQSITGQARAWPLYSAADPDTGRVTVSGWVGARVVSVDRPAGGGLRLVLQLAVVHHPSVVSDPDRVVRPGFWAGNKTVCRVRLAE